MPRSHNHSPEGVNLIEVPKEAIEHRAPPLYGQPVPAPERDSLAVSAVFSITRVDQVRPSRSLVIARKPDSFAAQQYRLLKFKLKEELDPRLIGVTSALPDEGKTASAANLGLALAEGRKTRVLLLDLNLRHPQLGQLFGIPLNGSIGSQLQRKRRHVDTRWEVLELGASLHLMAGEQPTENPAALLNSSEFSLLMNDLSDHYDYVVADLPAILNAADVKIIQEQLDGFVLVCRAGTTTRKAVSTSLFELGRAKLLGVLLSDVPDRFIPR